MRLNVNCPSPSSRRGFSLIELLACVAVISIVLALTISGFSNSSGANALARGGQQLSDIFILARQQAVTQNRKVFVRLIELPDSQGTLGYRAVQPWIVKDDLGTLAPLAMASSFPGGIVLAQDVSLSPLLQSPPSTGGTMSVMGATRKFIEIGFLANGALDGGATDQTSFLTLVQNKDAARSSSPRPDNFFAIHINPVTGGVTTFQP